MLELLKYCMSKKTTLLGILFTYSIIIGSEIVATVYLPYTRKPVFDALSGFSVPLFIHGLGIMFIINIILLSAQSIKGWVGSKISFMLRSSLTDKAKELWERKKYKTNVPNPCSRINDDVRVATETTVLVLTEVLISFVIVLGLLLGMIKTPLLLGTALLYSGFSVGLALFFRNPIVSSKVSQLNAESDHRLGLTKISNGGIDKLIESKWQMVSLTFNRYIAILRNYKMFTALQTAVLFILPFIIMAPDYFHHIITLGDVMEGTMSFDLLVMNAAIWVQLYPQITDIQASWIRIKELFNDIKN